jgi:hypothetical protein
MGLRGGAAFAGMTAVVADADVAFSWAITLPLSKAPMRIIETIKPDRWYGIMVRHRHALLIETRLIHSPGCD